MLNSKNYKRRIQKENQINATYKAQGVLTDILPSIDNIERALQIEGDMNRSNHFKKECRWFMKVY